MALNDGFWYIWVILFGLLIAMSIWRCQRRNAMLAAAQQEMVVIPTNQSINPPPGFVPMYVNGTIMYVPQYAYGQPVEQAYNPSINQPMSPVVAAVPISYEGQPINQSVNLSINPQPFTGQTYHLDDAPPAKEAGTYALPPQSINQSINQPTSPVNPAYHSPPPSYNPARRGEL